MGVEVMDGLGEQDLIRVLARGTKVDAVATPCALLIPQSSQEGGSLSSCVIDMWADVYWLVDRQHIPVLWLG